ncbi:MAG: hypothetical protein JST54_21020 [Deltaproteobacteria bacterium]|nr:hypothetical protein [Deltaproteobacteria bacterium]
MHTLIALMLSAAPLVTSPSATPPPTATAHNITVTAPQGFVRSKDGTTFVFSSPGKDAQMSIDFGEKDKAVDAQACLDEVVSKVAAGAKENQETYAATVIDGQPAVTQTTFTEDRKHRQRRLIGCNGKSFFLLDWVELTHAGPKYEKTFTQLLMGIKYAQPAK